MSLSLKQFARSGGLARSQAKTLANRAKMRAYWKAVRAGTLPAPRRYKAPPCLDVIAQAVRRLGDPYGVKKAEVFGSVARGQAKRGSDIDLIVTFDKIPGLNLIELQRKLESALGVRIDLLDAQTVADMTNPYRRASINADRKLIYER